MHAVESGCVVANGRIPAAANFAHDFAHRCLDIRTACDRWARQRCASRRLIDLPPVSARGLTVAEVDARIRTTIEQCEGGVDDKMETLDEAFAVHEAMAELSENCQEILDRFFARDESYRTIGEALDLPAGTIASRISRCLGRLREFLEGRTEADTPSGSR